MIKSLYPEFQKWSSKGSVYIISDTHFDDEDCKLICEGWPTPEGHLAMIKDWVHKHDTLIHLGDIGNPEYMSKVKGYKVLITGNHDKGVSLYKPYFDEIYTGPLFIGDRILLSHEPIYGLDWCINIHGHNHDEQHKDDATHINLAANVVNFCLFSLGDAIDNGMLSDVNGIHRVTIDNARTHGLFGGKNNGNNA